MDENQNNIVQEPVSSAGPIIGAIVILAVIVFGALYFMGEREENQALNNQLEEINTQSESDETAAIEADLNNTDVNNIDAGLETY
ncbi:MAG: hypothetical protein NUV78_01395 [Candidatus Zambryskibacteria bacterium]|nr:hypothetical protein [Candidatus Zambryskibacteria bacterium]